MHSQNNEALAELIQNTEKGKSFLSTQLEWWEKWERPGLLELLTLLFSKPSSVPLFHTMLTLSTAFGKKVVDNPNYDIPATPEERRLSLNLFWFSAPWTVLSEVSPRIPLVEYQDLFEEGWSLAKKHVATRFEHFREDPAYSDFVARYKARVYLLGTTKYPQVGPDW